MRHRLLLASLVATSLLGACAGGDDATEQSATEAPAVLKDSAGGAFEGDAADSTSLDPTTPTRDVITEVAVSLEAPSVERSVPLIEAAVRAESGVITFSETGSYSSRDDSADGGGWATIVARIPPDRVDAFIKVADGLVTQKKGVTGFFRQAFLHEKRQKRIQAAA